MTKQWISRDDSTKQVSIPPPAPSTFKFISLGKTEILIICILISEIYVAQSAYQDCVDFHYHYHLWFFVLVKTMCKLISKFL